MHKISPDQARLARVFFHLKKTSKNIHSRIALFIHSRIVHFIASNNAQQASNRSEHRWPGAQGTKTPSLQATLERIKTGAAMTHHHRQLKSAYQRSGLSFLGMSFEKAMEIKAIRIALECAVKSQTKGKPAPIQPALI